MAAKKKYAIVPVSPKTGKVIPRPKKGQAVYYAIQTPRGLLKKFPQDYPQAYLPSDLAGMNRALKKSGPDNLILYEQKSTEYLREGKSLQYGKDKKGKRKPLRKLKITYHQSKNQQRPLIVDLTRKDAKFLRQDGALKKRSKREIVDEKLSTVLKLPKGDKPLETRELFFKGKTLFETLRNVVIPLSKRMINARKANALRIDGTMRIYHPKQGFILSKHFWFDLRDTELRDFSKRIAKEARYALGAVGYRFTALADLADFQSEMNERAEENPDLNWSNYFKLGKRNGAGPRAEALTPLVPETPFKPSKVDPWNPEELQGGNRKGTPAHPSSHRVSVALKIELYRDPARPVGRKKAERKRSRRKAAKKAAKKSAKKSPRKPRSK